MSAKTCVNKFEDLESVPCEAGGLASFLYEYGSRDYCHDATNKRYSFRLTTLQSTLSAFKNNFEKCYVKRSMAERGLGENECVIDKAEVTECVCKCSDNDFTTNLCEKASDAKGSEAKMKKEHPLFDICGGSGKVCVEAQEKKLCDFLGDNENINEGLQRWSVENDICASLHKDDCTPSTLCGLDENDNCKSLWVACNDEQQEYFDKKKADYEAKQVPSDCMTDIDGKYKNKVALLKNEEYSIIIAAIVSLYLLCSLSVCTAIAVGAGTNAASAGASAKNGWTQNV